MRRAGFLCAVIVAALAARTFAQENGPEQPAGFHGEFASFDMVDAESGWAVGRAGATVSLLQTHDGGKNWTDISPKPGRMKNVATITDADEAIFYHPVDATHGWASVKEDDSADPGETLYFTGDGGRTWKATSFKSSVGTISSIQFPDPSHGFILVESDAALGHSQKATYRTTDGGQIWWTTSERSHEIDTDQSLPGTGFCGGMVFRNAKEGWINGTPRGDEDAFLFRTKNAGDTWEPYSFKAPSGFYRGYAEIGTPQFFGDQKRDGVLSIRFVQHDPERNAYTFYRTHDGGEHWAHVGFAPGRLTDGSTSFIDADRGWLLAETKLFATTDCGATWREVATDLRTVGNESVSQFYFVSPSVGWLVKDHLRDDHHYELLQTADGGHRWTHRCGPQGEIAPP